MLKIYICPRCYNIRMVSKRPNAVCLHCNQELEQCDISYDKYTRLDDGERKEYVSSWKQKIGFGM